MTDLSDRARGHWPAILAGLAGLTAEQLSDTHQPCPLCGGTDRYRFDDQDGAGTWFCNQCGGRDQRGGGGSGMDLLMRKLQLPYAEAARRVEQFLGMPSPEPKRRGKPWRQPEVPPADAAPPALDRGAVAQWCYRDADGRQLFWIQRIRLRTGGKAFLCRVWLDGAWHRPSRLDPFSCDWPTPRPLYGLAGLTQRPDAPVIITEGEKAANAAARMFPGHVSISWPNGAKAIDKADWQPLAGRDVILCPDADDPGRQAMQRLAGILEGNDCTVKICHPPADAPEGWDLADADGWTRAQADDWLGKAVEEMPEPEPQALRLVELRMTTEPFEILGWSEDRQRIHYQHRQSGQISSLKPAAQAGNLLTLAELEYWERVAPSEKGIDWAKALNDVIRKANGKVFSMEAMRGRGVWIDNNAVVWHLGDRLEVDGEDIALIDHRSSHHYPRLPRLDISPKAEPLSDDEGRAILDTIISMGWGGQHDGLHLAGWAVLASVGGALKVRPVLQLTSPFGSGKTYTSVNILQPMLGGLAISRSNSTEAGIRQVLRADSLPVMIDESEGEDPQRRAGHLKLSRLSYDGTATDRGTTHGQAISYAVRSSICLIGINTFIANPADRSRTVVVSRRQLPAEQWAQVDRQVQPLITTSTGERLIRRTITNLHTLRANAATFRRVVEAQLAGSGAARAGDTYGHVLAGAHMLISTARLNDETALEWLDSIGWTAAGAMGETGAAVVDGAAEAWQCLQHLLSHEEQWKSDGGTGRITIAELVRQRTSDATTALGRRGIKVTDHGLVVANHAEALAPIYGRTKWAGGGHSARLRDLPGADAVQKRFEVIGPARGTCVPLQLVQGPD